MTKRIESAAIFVVLVITLIINICILESRNNKLIKELSQKEKDIQQTNVELANAIENFQHEYELNEILRAELSTINTTISDLKQEEYKLIYIGDYTITHYCVEATQHICGTGTGLTAIGTQVTAGKTIAVDPKVIPYGTKVYIEGYGWRIAEDCGGAIKGNHIDVAVESHYDAINMGTKTSGVWILVK